MNEIIRTGSLLPFPQLPHPNILIQVSVKKVQMSSQLSEILSLEYSLEGEVARILVPSLGKKKLRLDQLWEHTCFEAFLSWKKQRSYWEVNISPTGNWNLYKFDEYRKNFRQEEKINCIEFEVLRHTEQDYKCKAEIELSALKKENENSDVMQVGITAVIEDQNHNLSYWALHHAAERPDFHLRSSFILSIS